VTPKGIPKWLKWVPGNGQILKNDSSMRSVFNRFHCVHLCRNTQTTQHTQQWKHMLISCKKQKMFGKRMQPARLTARSDSIIVHLMWSRHTVGCIPNKYNYLGIGEEFVEIGVINSLCHTRLRLSRSPLATWLIRPYGGIQWRSLPMPKPYPFGSWGNLIRSWVRIYVMEAWWGVWKPMWELRWQVLFRPV
jgi:hypothetical protein